MMFKKLVAALLVFAIAFCAFAACGDAKVEEPETENTTETTTETTTEEPAQGLDGVEFSNEDTIKMSNYMNHGKAAYSGSWIYGVSFVDHKGVFSKFKEDDSEENVLNADYPSFINIIGGWVYFLGYKYADGTFAIKKVRLSGDDDTTLIRAKAGYKIDSMFIYDGKIYFSEYKGNSQENVGKFCCCDLDGKNRETVLDKSVFFPYIINDNILYQDDGDGEKLHICNLDGSDDRVLIDRHVYSYIVYGSDIYYQSSEKGFYDKEGNPIDNVKQQLRKCRLDGSDDKVFLDLTNVGQFFAIINDTLYYIDENDEERLYLYDFNTESIDLVSQDTLVGMILSLNPSNKILYYDGMVENGKTYIEHIYVCNPDGTGKRDINE